jgi:Superinfection immunity protein
MNTFAKAVGMIAGVCLLMAFVGALHDPQVSGSIMSMPTAVVAGVIMLVALYFLPSIIGTVRGVTGINFLSIVNFLFGWTVIGWFGCLIWAGFGQTKAQKAFYERHMKC